MQRLSAGLFTLQLVDYIILEVCSSGASSIKVRVMQILSQRGASVKTIRHVMRGMRIKTQNLWADFINIYLI